ncbi:MAG: glycosyltransferase family 2 protein [Elusimicrobiota bacterium]|nr:MAG: glycosyltransferase family 2 protein [Elusimicrobiota bacterium]
MSALTVSVVVPAYNEAEAIGQVVADLHAELLKRGVASEIIVVDDGSTDKTAEAVSPAHGRVIKHPTNGGYGRALLTGIEAAKHEWVLMIDADGSYPPSEILKLLDYAPAFDLVIGAREGAHFWGTPTKAFLRWVYLRLASFVVGARVPDANSGLRLVRKSLVDQRALVRCLGYSFTTTMTLSFLMQGRFVKYLPIEFRARTGGHSKVKPFRDILRTLQLMTQVMIIYNPLKLFVTLTILLALKSALLAALAVVWGVPILLLCASVAGACAFFSFTAGCVLDSMRMHGQWRP